MKLFFLGLGHSLMERRERAHETPKFFLNTSKAYVSTCVKRGERKTHLKKY